MSDRPHPATLLLWLLLLGVGLLIAHAGVKAIRERSYDFQQEEDSDLTIGPVGIGANHQEWTDHYRGADAIRVGAGLVIFGSTFVLWSLFGTWETVRPKRMEMGRSARVAIILMSALLLTGTLVCLFPPWRFTGTVSDGVWLTIIGIGLLLLWAVNSKGKDATTGKVMKFWFVGGTCLVMVLSLMIPHFWVGSLVGVFAAIFYAVHAGLIRGLLKTELL